MNAALPRAGSPRHVAPPRAIEAVTLHGPPSAVLSGGGGFDGGKLVAPVLPILRARAHSTAGMVWTAVKDIQDEPPILVNIRPVWQSVTPAGRMAGRAPSRSAKSNTAAGSRARIAKPTSASAEAPLSALTRSSRPPRAAAPKRAEPRHSQTAKQGRAAVPARR